MKLTGTRAAVLGLGTSGAAAAEFLQRRGTRVTLLESFRSAPTELKAKQLEALGVTVLFGADAENVRADFDLYVISPGIDPAVHLVQNLAKQGATFFGELELGYRFCSKPIIAITGTNGKTTTTQMIEQMLQTAGQRTVACGNIGLPFCAAVERQSEFDYLTVEVSSFQLETIQQFRPLVSVWLNFTPDHLDRYRDLEDYRAAKLRVFERQEASDWTVVNAKESLPPLAAQRLTFSAYSKEADCTWDGQQIYYRGRRLLDLAETHVSGPHNAENLMAAIEVAAALGLDWEAAIHGLRDFRLAAHRCELVREFAGVRYINDSKATNPDSLAKALEAQTGQVVLIAGGKYKGFDFQVLRPLVAQKVKAAVLIGETTAQMNADWSSVTRCIAAPDLTNAVQSARHSAVPGDVVLLSPGTSSFDMFKNYADRGNQFRQLVQELT